MSCPECFERNKQTSNQFTSLRAWHTFNQAAQLRAASYHTLQSTKLRNFRRIYELACGLRSTDCVTTLGHVSRHHKAQSSRATYSYTYVQALRSTVGAASARSHAITLEQHKV